MLRNQYDRYGWLFAVAMFVLSVPVTAVLVWTVVMFIGGVFDVFMSVDIAFSIIFYTSLLVGPAFIAWRLWRPRAPVGK